MPSAPKPRLVNVSFFTEILIKSKSAGDELPLYVSSQIHRNVYEHAVIKKIPVHVGLYQVQEKKRAPPMIPKDYTERVEIVPCDDDWPGYEERVAEY